MGILLRRLERYSEAKDAFRKAIEINPEDFKSYLAVISINKQLDIEFPLEYVENIRRFLPEDDWFNLARLESVVGFPDLAFEHLQKAAESDDFDPVWAWDDPDLQWIRNDPRFINIVGLKSG